MKPPLGSRGGFFIACYAYLEILTGKREMVLVKEDIGLIREMIAKAFAEWPQANQANVRRTRAERADCAG
jgi:hypothetical protein